MVCRIVGRKCTGRGGGREEEEEEAAERFVVAAT